MNSVRPMNLRDLLKAHGWKSSPVGQDYRLFVMENDDYPRRQLVFPMDEEAPDYADASSNVLQKLSDILGSSIAGLTEQAASIADDVLKLRILTPRDVTTLPLNFAAELIAGAQKALKASACTVLKPRLHHPRLTLSDAVALIDKCIFRQTEPGSFIVKVSCPVEALDTDGNLELGFDEFPQKPPFVRQVMLSLYSATEGLIRAIEHDELEGFVHGVRSHANPVLSSNVCEALTMLRDEGLDNSVDLTINWSPSVPIPTRFRRPLRVKREYFSRIEEVTRQLRQSQGEHEDTFIGTVERLDGEMLSTGQRAGEVILTLLMDGESVRAKVLLDAEQYRVADQAHMSDGTYVQVRGRLRPGRQPRQLVELEGFQAIYPKA